MMKSIKAEREALKKVLILEDNPATVEVMRALVSEIEIKTLIYTFNPSLSHHWKIPDDTPNCKREHKFLHLLRIIFQHNYGMECRAICVIVHFYIATVFFYNTMYAFKSKAMA